MMMMLVGLDEERITKDGYDVKSMWDIVDKTYDLGHCEKEAQPDGTVLYKGNTKSTNLLGDFFLPYAYLADNPYFAKYCTKWFLYSNERDEKLPLYKMDCLIRERKENPLFQQK